MFWLIPVSGSFCHPWEWSDVGSLLWLTSCWGLLKSWWLLITIVFPSSWSAAMQTRLGSLSLLLHTVPAEVTPSYSAGLRWRVNLALLICLLWVYWDGLWELESGLHQFLITLIKKIQAFWEVFPGAVSEKWSQDGLRATTHYILEVKTVRDCPDSGFSSDPTYS